MRGRTVAACLLLGVLAAAAVRAQEPVYADALLLPVEGDRVGAAAAVSLDPGSGEILVCDGRRHRILIFDRDGLFRFEIAGGEHLQGPKDVAVDRDGFLFVLTSSGGRLGQILELDFDGELRRAFELIGLPEDSARPRLVSLAVTADGRRLYLLDDANAAVWIADREGRISGRVDLAAGLEERERRDLILGQLDLYGDRLLVAVPSLSEVRCYRGDGAPCGVVNSRGRGQCGLAFPTAAARDGEGNYLIIDQQRMVILRWNPVRNECLGEYYGLGSAPGYLYYPYDLALDAAGRLFVAQAFEGKVQMYAGLSPALLPGETRASAAARASEIPGPAPRPEPAEDVTDLPVLEAAAAAEALQEERPAAESPDELVAAVEPSVAESIESWARAWADQRIEDYLAAYSEHFRPPAGLDRDAWQRLRRSRVGAPAFIEVTLEEVAVELEEPESARATFLQTYRSDRFADRVRKLLVLRREEGAWRILEERVLETLDQGP